MVGILVAVLPRIFTPSCPLEVEIDDKYLHDAIVTS